jgi:hypothetical protein
LGITSISFSSTDVKKDSTLIARRARRRKRKDRDMIVMVKAITESCSEQHDNIQR